MQTVTTFRHVLCSSLGVIALALLSGCMSPQARGFPKVTPGMTYSKVGELMGTPQQHIQRRQLSKSLDDLAARTPPKGEWCLAPLYFQGGGYVLPECWVYSEKEFDGGIRQFVIVFSDHGAVANTYITKTKGPGNPETWFPADIVKP
ncbi:MAG: hypothetical protein K8T26_08440 [Lentisphaerae bacterium]|nr:hypothetical protein [Lentisphaerota bacterium]